MYPTCLNAAACFATLAMYKQEKPKRYETDIYVLVNCMKQATPGRLDPRAASSEKLPQIEFWLTNTFRGGFLTSRLQAEFTLDSIDIEFNTGDSFRCVSTGERHFEHRLRLNLDSFVLIYHNGSSRRNLRNPIDGLEMKPRDVV